MSHFVVKELNVKKPSVTAQTLFYLSNSKTGKEPIPEISVRKHSVDKTSARDFSLTGKPTDLCCREALAIVYFLFDVTESTWVIICFGFGGQEIIDPELLLFCTHF